MVNNNDLNSNLTCNTCKKVFNNKKALLRHNRETKCGKKTRMLELEKEKEKELKEQELQSLFNILSKLSLDDILSLRKKLNI